MLRVLVEKIDNVYEKMENLSSNVDGIKMEIPFFFGLFVFLWLHLRHMDIPRLGVQLEL